MYPSFDIGPLSFPAYFTLLFVGYFIVVTIAERDGARRGLDQKKLSDLALILLVAGIIGARGLHVIADGYWDEYVKLCTNPLETKGELLPKNRKCKEDEECVRADKDKTRGWELCNKEKGTCHQGRDCLRVFKFWYGGLAYYGGLVLAILVGYWYVRRQRMPTWEVGDLAGFAIPLGLVFGRIGCFLAGCCYGEVCAHCSPPIAFSFPQGSPAWEAHVEQGLINKNALESLPVYPTQLWEALLCLFIFMYLYFYLRFRKKFSGQLFFEFLMLYALCRFIIEFWRADPRGELFGLSTSQLIGIPMFLYGAFMWISKKKTCAKVEDFNPKDK